MSEIHAVTGAFGFSGKYMAKRLLDAGKEVITLTDSPNRPNPFKGVVKAYPFSFDDPEKLTESLAGVSVLYNTYWVRFNHPLFTHGDAVKNSLTLFQAAKDAGVRRIVHISISSADEHSPLGYFAGKGRVERAVMESGLSYAILRPAALFGDRGILINNIAWTLRHMPVFGVLGDGKYHIQPIFVDDLAKLAVEQGEKNDNAIIPAIGPEDFVYRDLVKTIGRIIGHPRPMINLPPALGYAATVIVGKLMGDIFVTKEEVAGLLGDTLHIPGAAPTGTTRLTDWLVEHKNTIGLHYESEIKRRVDRKMGY